MNTGKMGVFPGIAHFGDTRNDKNRVNAGGFVDVAYRGCCRRLVSVLRSHCTEQLNPTINTLSRNAEALGKRIVVNVVD
ncbi:MAG: hypothetical protein HZA46_09890 [Planctomycetales bacterium]|nr:hypothetical protein [Planctomycetales bacterium]